MTDFFVGSLVGIVEGLAIAYGLYFVYNKYIKGKTL